MKLIIYKCDICENEIKDINESREVRLSIIDGTTKGDVENRKPIIEHTCVFCQTQIANYISELKEFRKV